MLPNFFVEETIARESGESAIFEIGQFARQSVVLTFGITHAVEQQHIQLQIYGSADGRVWSPRPLLNFPPKCYCGEYQLTLPPCDMPYLKAAWRARPLGAHGSAAFFPLLSFRCSRPIPFSCGVIEKSSVPYRFSISRSRRLCIRLTGISLAFLSSIFN